jgi:hypothetical protein
MAVAIGMLLSFISQRARLVTAIVGGAGFGTFIDELGKFVTSDNNYFFKPTAALIYVIFVIGFLAGRAIRTGGRLDPVESVANAVDVLREAAGRQLDAVSRNRALALLASAGERELMVPALQQLFFSLPIAERPLSAAGRLWARLNRLYLRLVRALVPMGGDLGLRPAGAGDPAHGRLLRRRGGDPPHHHAASDAPAFRPRGR